MFIYVLRDQCFHVQIPVLLVRYHGSGQFANDPHCGHDMPFDLSGVIGAGEVTSLLLHLNGIVYLYAQALCKSG